MGKALPQQGEDFPRGWDDFPWGWEDCKEFGLTPTAPETLRSGIGVGE
jgi:hypothetical protein